MPEGMTPTNLPKGDHDDSSSHWSSPEDGISLNADNSSDPPRPNKGGNESTSLDVGKKESTVVGRLRGLVVAAILFAAVGVSVAVYILTSNNEEDEFQIQFEGAASKVVTSFEDIVAKKLATIGSLAVQCSLYARSQNATWPFVTTGDFQLRSATARELSGSLFTRLVPVVTNETRVAWEEYSLENMGWLQEAREYLVKEGIDISDWNRMLQEDNSGLDEVKQAVDFSSGIGDKIYGFDENSNPIPSQVVEPLFPLWQESPTFGRDLTNMDVNYYPDYTRYMIKAYETGDMTIGGLDTAQPGDMTDPDLSTSYFSYLISLRNGERTMYKGDPMSSVFLPVFDDFEAANRRVVAIIFAVFKWASYFENLLPPNFPGLQVVLENNCEGAFTYHIVGSQVEYLGQGDLHDTRYDHMVRKVEFSHANEIGEESSLGLKLNQDICTYTLRVYPSPSLEDHYVTRLPLIITFSIVLVFICTGGVFLLFNRFVERRQRLVMNQAVKSTAIVSSLFPEGVRDRLLDMDMISGKSKLKSFLSDGDDSQPADAYTNQVIADLFPNCTVFFGDVAGFTAWSSARDPAQVFLLLQTIYQAFDTIAKTRGVFKVETVGDCYVAVTGLPNPNPKHAVVMARFASECLVKFKELTSQLESTLGPDTGDLGLRIGLHCGPVTAGVLRGDRSRFQLFGDTVNTAARMESSGSTNAIQISDKMASLLVESGKGHWILKRADAVEIKGKGLLETYWLTPRAKKAASVSSGSSRDASHRLDHVHTLPNVSLRPAKDVMKQERLIDWMVELFVKRICMITARQDPAKVGRCKPSELVYHLAPETTSLDEVAEVIRLPKFCAKSAARAKRKGKVEIGAPVVQQLRDVIATIAEMYRLNPFHNFEHACHVTMAVDKFLNRIATLDVDDTGKGTQGLASELHDYTHGITSDPIALLAIVFSALVHDADHRGVSNMQLAKEEEMMASMYRNKSIAEQNSLDLAWDIFMEEQHHELRAALFVDRSELLRFRQVMVNVVLATDIFDKELNDLRKNRWDAAFNGENDGELNKDLRATIVIEHIIQASDVAHTMQHWHIYRKWNERLFIEMYLAFQEGRMGKSPVEFWYEGELGFFDNYVIPLAKKLDTCKVFGVSSDECFNYATQNRLEWEKRGKEVLASMVEKTGTGNLNIT